MKIIIGNRTYSSWSLRGWLAAKQSLLPFETELRVMDSPEWISGAAKTDMPSGKVPVLWDHGEAIWDSMAILLYLADKAGHDRFWPRDTKARGLAYAMCAEMHSGFAPLRAGCPMDLQRHAPRFQPTPEIMADVRRIEQLWETALTRFGAETGEPWLFGRFGAADIMFAPVCTRIDTYHLPVSDAARAYVDLCLAHPFMAEWRAEAMKEDFPFTRYDVPGLEKR
ncbi:glutathione S-transferase [Sandarakinorhabdus oryzae]|uniref:glutathione S-transferase n=1 Tax=Sandarakinorhabdus oryzae TaxID=2675220 RepID=UPI0012E15BF8|nr:glutathione S-transferase [Sandarakinorhabdus oryzae]